MSIISRAYFVFDDDDDNSGGWVTQHWNNLALHCFRKSSLHKQCSPPPLYMSIIFPKIFQINELYIIL